MFSTEAQKELINSAVSKNLSDENIRYEQIGNTMYMMSTPSEIHESIIFEVLGQLWVYFKGKPCRAYGSNVGLDLKEFIPILKNHISFQEYFKKKINSGKEDEAFLLPDVSVLCDIDRSQFSSHGYRKVPKMLIEVSSPSTDDRDFDEKKDIYEAIGVCEYWIISDIQNVTVYLLKDGKFVKTKYRTEENILDVPVSVFPNLTINFDRNEFNR